MPIARSLLTETLKAAPGVAADIFLRRKSPGTAVLQGLKKAGMNTLRKATPFGAIFVGRGKKRKSVSKAASKRIGPPKKRRKVAKRRNGAQSDIFS
jgi:hypothetical protein